MVPPHRHRKVPPRGANPVIQTDPGMIVTQPDFRTQAGQERQPVLHKQPPIAGSGEQADGGEQAIGLINDRA